MTNEKKIKIRPAAAADLHAIIAIEAECFPPAEAASEKEFRERFQAFGENFFVAETEGRVIGFINGCTTDTAILPDELYHDTGFHKKDGSYQTVFGLDVLPEYRNQGWQPPLWRR